MSVRAYMTPGALGCVMMPETKPPPLMATFFQAYVSPIAHGANRSSDSAALRVNRFIKVFSYGNGGPTTARISYGPILCAARPAKEERIPGVEFRFPAASNTTILPITPNHSIH